MAGLLPEEKQMIAEALQVYLQFAAQQMPQETIEALAARAQELIKKIDTLGATNADGTVNNKPSGISEEWFSSVCSSCVQLNETGCADSVTAKYPGKCDPILKYEFQKTRTQA